MTTKVILLINSSDKNMDGHIIFLEKAFRLKATLEMMKFRALYCPLVVRLKQEVLRTVRSVA